MAAYTTFYPTSTVEFYTQTTTMTWRGAWAQVIPRALVQPSYGAGNVAPPLAPVASDLPVMNLCPFQRGMTRKTSTYVDSASFVRPNLTTGLYRCVTSPLDAQTVGGTLNVTFPTFGTTSALLCFRIYAAILIGDTDAVRGVLGTYEDPNTNAWPGTGFFGQTLATPMAFAPVNAQAGDRLLLEIGTISRSVPASITLQRSVAWGQVANGIPLTPITPGQIGSTSTSPWVVFSQPLAIQDITLETGDIIVGNIDIFHYRPDGTLKGVTLTVNGGTGSGVGMPDGTLWTPSAETGIEHWSNTMELLSTVSDEPVKHQPHVVRRAPGDLSGAVYIGNPNLTGPCDSVGEDFEIPLDGLIQKVAGGAIVQEWSPAVEWSGIPSFDFMPDGVTIVYTSLGSSIKVYNLATSTQLPDIVTLTQPPTTLLYFRGVRCLADGSVIAATKTEPEGATPDSSDLRHYSATGTLLQTYSIAGQMDWGTLSITNDGLSFWAANTGRGNTGTGPCMMARFNIATGAVEDTIIGDQYIMRTSGAHLCSGGQCIIPVISIVPPPDPDPGTIVVEKFTVPPNDTPFEFTTTGLTPSTFSLAHGGTAIFPDLEPGSGFGVAETPVDDVTVTVTVSNSSPIDNITVGEGETVTVTFTNYIAFNPEGPFYPNDGDAIDRLIRRVRRAPTIKNELHQMRFAMLQLDVQSGVSLTTGQGSDAVINLRWSNNGGKTWSNLYPMPIGKLGRYATRVIWHRLAAARNRVFEVSMSDPVAWVIVDAYLNAEEGTGN